MPTTDTPPLRFEQAVAELERILRELEDGTTSLEDGLARYERGVTLLRSCYGQLRDAEQKIRLLAGTTEDGAADLKPFEHVATIDNVRHSVRKPGRNSRNSGIAE